MPGAGALSLASCHRFLSRSPSEAVLSTSCHTARLFESLSPSPTAFFSPSPSLQQIRCTFWQEHEPLLCPAQATAALPGSCLCFFPRINSECLQGCFLLLVPVASGQDRGKAEGMEPAFGYFRRPVLPCGGIPKFGSAAGARPFLPSAGISPLHTHCGTGESLAKPPAQLIVSCWKNWLGGQWHPENTCSLMVVLTLRSWGLE